MTISENQGKFLTRLRLSDKYDRIVVENSHRGKEKPKSVIYLTCRIQNEIIYLPDETVRKKNSEIKDAKYFSIMPDSTRDIVHEVQFTESCVTFVLKVYIKNIFLGLFSNQQDKVILVNSRKLEEYEISINSLLNFWYPNLSSLEKISKGLQYPKMGFLEYSCNLKRLIRILNFQIFKISHISIFSVNDYCEKWGIPNI